jgi:hypothetical protein
MEEEAVVAAAPALAPMEEAAAPMRLAGPKKPRRMIGLAVGITGDGGPVVVESLGKGGAGL